MSRLILYHASNNYRQQRFVEALSCEGVRLERWPLKSLGNVEWAFRTNVLSAYEDQIAEVKEALGYRYADFVTVDGQQNSAIHLRDKYLSEHTHLEHEVRFFLSGESLLFLHVKGNVHVLHCVEGDFLIIPKGMKHWLDMGPTPRYQCIRWYDSKEGLVNQPTGSYSAELNPRWESVLGVSNESLDRVGFFQPS